LLSWKRYFEKLNEEFEVAEKKRQALNNLLDSGKISPSTHQAFNREIDEAIAEVEIRRKDLLEKMALKAVELENRVGMLEMLLANLEIHRVTGEVDDEAYKRETTLVAMGLETARQELDVMREASSQLSTKDQAPPTPTEEPVQQSEPPQTDTQPMEQSSIIHGEAEESKSTDEIVVEPLRCSECQPPSNERTESEGKQEA